MLSPSQFYKQLETSKITFFSGVPDSLLKNFCAYLSDNLSTDKHLIAANEGGAVGLAIGYHLATGEIPCVYMQNSGLGNVVNPILSMVDPEVCNIPMLLLIGWRGEPGVKDEPQHVKQGRVMLEMLEAMEIPYLCLDEDPEQTQGQIDQAVSHLKTKGGPFALVVRKNTFEKYTLATSPAQEGLLSREEVIASVSARFSNKAVFVSTTGMTSRELFETRERRSESHDKDFLVIGGMGHASQIALGAALNKPDKTVVCLDGDGAMLMHMGALAMNGTYAPENLIHIVINNGAHESVGGQETIAQRISIQKIAHGCGYAHVQRVETQESLHDALKTVDGKSGPHFIEIITACGHRDDLGRPTQTPMQNTSNVRAFMESD
ncbi:Phosphonopyruvate decarboxylase [Candidatus Terasakiella magnetica]|uniref:Phosphonopyruvate decarboxylase n=1 Tax=Candidatus Terasakiella magnetica TaxID=1867952 RepID=A0A1C3RG93_9PROT|nr:phosphonopyruvate decarboxylase [Candidatus Terasakiella magnetica]SCA56271.1 Phosphonopyruvate decarboxylase [Candidatus Terasakiella magnetica]